MRKPLMLMSSLILAVSCGGNSSDNSSTVSSSAFNEAYEQLVESAPAYSSKRNFVMNSSFQGKAVTIPDWDTSTDFWNVGGNTPLSPQDYVGYMMGESNDQSIFNRARMPFLISCCLDILAEKNGNLFSSGTQTFEFTDAVVGVCGDESEFTGLIGEEMTIEISDLTDTSNYDQKIYFSSNLNPMFDHDQWMYVRNNDSVLNFMHIEGTSGSDFYASSISFNKTTEGGFFQYINKSTFQHNFYRIYMDPTDNLARIFSYSKNDVGNSNATNSFVITSTFTDQTEAALSISWSNLSGTYNSNVTDGNACVSTTDGSILTNNTDTCSGNNRTTLASTGASGIITAFGLINDTTILTDADSGNLADNLPTFDESSILTANIGL